MCQVLGMNNAKILRVDKIGAPLSWISPQEASTFIMNARVLWTLGEETVVLRGGINCLGERSILEIPAIIATKGRNKKANDTPALCRSVIYARDHYSCLYCGEQPGVPLLSLDHVIPVSRGGPTTFQNLVTACRRCNTFKRDRTPEEANMKLLAVPFVPSKHEFLYLSNRRILKPEQLAYLKSGIRDELLYAA
ncbi:HNH endonuclease [Litoribacillus peritrichatus]|uniref:HNH endonuclease n=2 Tax=Litoribacillus peritrichatus TaxID=718191 RepID=A0ABP7MIE7_9GAMM